MISCTTDLVRELSDIVVCCTYALQRQDAEIDDVHGFEVGSIEETLAVNMTTIGPFAVFTVAHSQLEKIAINFSHGSHDIDSKTVGWKRHLPSGACSTRYIEQCWQMYELRSFVKASPMTRVCCVAAIVPASPQLRHLNASLSRTGVPSGYSNKQASLSTLRSIVLAASAHVA